MGSPHIKSSFQCAEWIQGTCDPFIPGDEPRCTWKDNRAARKSKELLRTATFQGCRVLPPLSRRCNCSLELCLSSIPAEGNHNRGHKFRDNCVQRSDRKVWKEGWAFSEDDGKDQFLGEKIGAPSSAFEEARRGMVQGLLKSLSDRFEEGAEGIVAAASIANLKLWPTSLFHEKDFGDDKVDTLVKTFGQVLTSSALDISKVEPEWTKLKSLLYTSYPTVKKLSWEEVNLSFGTQCPIVLGLIDLILTLPASSADAEMGFSHMKFVKSDWRSRLSDTHLSDLMTVLMETLDVDQFDPSSAVKHWNHAGPRARRPNIITDIGDVDDDSDESEMDEDAVAQILKDFIH